MNIYRSGMFQMIATAFLLMVIGVSAFSLIVAQSDSYRRLRDTQEECMNLRIASNYLLMRVRQHNEAGGISITETPSGPCLVLHEFIDGDEFVTRIFLYGSRLTESFTYADEPFYAGSGYPICGIDYFNITYSDENNMLSFELRYRNSGIIINILVVSGGESFGQ
jgi:hypothetical protein